MAPTQRPREAGISIVNEGGDVKHEVKFADEGETQDRYGEKTKKCRQATQGCSFRFLQDTMLYVIRYLPFAICYMPSLVTLLPSD